MHAALNENHSGMLPCLLGLLSWRVWSHPGTAEVLGHVCLLCAAQVSGSFTCVKNVPEICPEAFHQLLLTQVLCLMAWAKFHKFTFLFFSHSLWYMPTYSPTISELKKKNTPEKRGRRRGGRAGKGPGVESEASWPRLPAMPHPLPTWPHPHSSGQLCFKESSTSVSTSVKRE